MVSYPFRFIENHHLASEHIKKLKTKNKVFKQWMEVNLLSFEMQVS